MLPDASAGCQPQFPAPVGSVTNLRFHSGHVTAATDRGSEGRARKQEMVSVNDKSTTPAR